MKHVYWLREGRIAGRPGPDQQMWDLEELSSNGISAILSVNRGDMVHETLLSRLGIAWADIPMSSNAPIRDGDREICLHNLPKAMRFIRENRASGPLLVHCRSGKDRTGMVLAAYLVEFEDYDVEQAMESVLAVRPIAFTADGWMDFSRDVLGLFRAGNGDRDLPCTSTVAGDA